MSSALIDSSFLVALNVPKDQYHTLARRFIAVDDHLHLIPQIVLTEAAYLIGREMGLPRVIRFMDSVADPAINLQSIVSNDLVRARSIMAEYKDAEFDFVDCCLMALAERLNITEICTFDRRDFSIFRPIHTEYLTLLP